MNIQRTSQSFNHSFRPQQPLTRVSSRHKCPICHKPDYCGGNDSIAICMRIRSDKQARNGGWIHKLRENLFNQDQRPRPTEFIKRLAVEPQKISDAEDLSIRKFGIYSKLNQECLVLAQNHRKSLRERGLNDEAINHNGYRSTPWVLYADNIARALAPYDLNGVPGFYKDGERWRMVKMPAGITIPVRDWRARIQGMMIRRDEGKPKYVWLSSNPDLKDDDDKQRYPHGTSSGAPVHHSRPELIRVSNSVIVTEGALKADCISHLSGQPAIGVAGVSTFGQNFTADLRSHFPQLSEVVVAYDKDLYQKKEVYDALMRLTAQLERARFRVRIRDWAGDAKGYDDFLLSQVRREVAA